jgi:hypothetical protein
MTYTLELQILYSIPTPVHTKSGYLPCLVACEPEAHPAGEKDVVR